MQSVPETEQIPASLDTTNEQSASSGTQHLASQTQSIGQMTQLSEQQIAKLQSELDVVQGNMRVLSEMLAYFTSPDQSSKQQPDSADLELLNVGISYIFFSSYIFIYQIFVLYMCE